MVQCKTCGSSLPPNDSHTSCIFHRICSRNSPCPLDEGYGGEYWDNVEALIAASKGVTKPDKKKQQKGSSKKKVVGGKSTGVSKGFIGLGLDSSPATMATGVLSNKDQTIKSSKRSHSPEALKTGPVRSLHESPVEITDTESLNSGGFPPTVATSTSIKAAPTSVGLATISSPGISTNKGANSNDPSSGISTSISGSPEVAIISSSSALVMSEPTHSSGAHIELPARGNIPERTGVPGLVPQAGYPAVSLPFIQGMATGIPGIVSPGFMGYNPPWCPSFITGVNPPGSIHNDSRSDAAVHARVANYQLPFARPGSQSIPYESDTWGNAAKRARVVTSQPLSAGPELISSIHNQSNTSPNVALRTRVVTSQPLSTGPVELNQSMINQGVTRSKAAKNTRGVVSNPLSASSEVTQSLPAPQPSPFIN